MTDRRVLKDRRINAEVTNGIDARDYLEAVLAVEALSEEIKRKDDEIRACEAEIRSLSNVVNQLHLDPKYWIGFAVTPQGR